MSSHIARHSLRRQVIDIVPITDVMTAREIGSLMDVSENGMMLQGAPGLLKDGLYQLRFALKDGNRVHQIDVGVHLLWLGQTSMQGRQQAGFRFLTISDEHREQIRRWIENGDRNGF